MIRFWLKKFIIPIAVALAVFVIADHDAWLYKEPVAEIVSLTSQTKPAHTDDYGNRDQQVNQTLELRLLNTPQKGKEVSLPNTVMKSQVTGQIYRQGQKILLRQTGSGFQIIGQKRDAVMLALLTLFIGLLIAFVRFRSSALLLLSLGLNLLYFIGAIALDIQLASSLAILIFSLLGVLFVASSLAFVLGLSRQMLYSFFATILTCLLTFGLAAGVLALTGNNGVHFEYLNYVTQNPSEFFFVGAIISVLGAIMDGTGDIMAGLFGMERQALDFSRLDYFKSGLSIGQEIIGTLTNILFMIFMAETIPLSVLLLKNGNDWSYIGTVALNLGLLQTLISAIGIVLAVPVTAGLASLLLGRARA